MKTIRIRTFAMLCLFFILLLPWICFVAAHFMETKTLSLGKSQPQNELLHRQVSETVHLIETSSDKWLDPNWQKQLQFQLRETKLEVAILSATDQEIYRSYPEGRGAFVDTERFSILEDGKILGKVVLYLPKSNMLQMLSILAGLILAFTIVGIAMGRFLLKPLERMSVAARQIASGDWDVRLPLSRVREIAEVRDGFEIMVKGLQKSAQKQVEMEEERRFVIAAVAHDLRTPLFALRGYLDGLEQGIARSPDKIAKYLAVCKEKSAQLDRLVEDLFTFTQMEYSELKQNYNNTFDLKLILQKSIDSLSPLAHQKHISISYDSTEDCIVNGDSHFMERALNNLLDNAVRHTPSYGEILVRCYQKGNKVKFTIRDTGPGFSSEDLQKVFDPLYRGEASRNRLTGGSGLGLTIAQRILRGHGGELEAGNHPQGGALLTGWLPSCR